MLPHNHLTSFTSILCLLLLSTGCIRAFEDVCPSACVCTTNSIVNCTRSSLDSAPDELPRWTKVLVYDHNSLTIFPLIDNVDNLETLSLIDNNLSSDSIDQVDISGYPKLKTLDLSENALGHISKHFLARQFHQVNTKLTTLILHNSRINTIDSGAFDLLVNLAVLKLSRNNLVVVSSGVFNPLGFLRELDLNSNRIEDFHNFPFNGTKSLQVLKLRRNKINKLPVGVFYGLTNLQKLNLEYNNITEIQQQWTFGLTSLTELTLGHNAIRSIDPNSWGKDAIEKLSELYLSHNQLPQIDRHTFSKLSLLKVLKLSHNRISIIDENAFHPLTFMENLDLSNNQLSWTIDSSDGFFSKLHSLKKLRLDNNEIRLILKHTFSGLTELSHLSLSNNPISSIQNGSFSWFKNLNELNLENTDLLCDCTIKWLFEWLSASDNRRKFATGIRCKHPTQLSLRTEHSFLDAEIGEFKCLSFLKPYLIDDFQNIDKPISAIKGKNATFYCKVVTSNADRIQFKWIKNNKVIDSNHNRIKYETLASPSPNSPNASLYTNVFTLINVSDEDEGNYQCMASNNYDIVYSHKFQVKVNVIPYFTTKPNNVIVKVGDTAKLQCAAQGQPTPKLQWQKDAFRAIKENRLRFIPDDEVVFIVDVTKEDNGTYNCIASNDAGTVSTTATLTVYEPPAFVRKMKDQYSDLNSFAEFECAATGIPMPEITWYKNGAPLEANERYTINEQGQKLSIDRLEGTDQGRYSCKIINEYGTTEDFAFLRVTPSIKKGNDFSYALPPSENIVGSLKNFMNEHRQVLLLIVLICLLGVLLSIVYFLIVFVNRRKLNQTDTKQPDVENFNEDDDYPDFDNVNSGSVNIQTYSQFTELDYYSEDSEKDTGIEGSCTTEDDSEPIPYSYAPDKHPHIYYHYQSLPRETHLYPSIMQMSLPRTHHNNPENQFSQSLVQHNAPSYDNSNYIHNKLPLSNREKRLLKKKIKNDQITNIKQNVGQIACIPDAKLQTFSYRSYSVNDINHT